MAQCTGLISERLRWVQARNQVQAMRVQGFKEVLEDMSFLLYLEIVLQNTCITNVVFTSVVALLK